MSKEPRRAYLDHASSTPLRPAAYEAMLPWLAHPGDPGRVHSEGRAARFALEEAREQIAAFFGARPREVVFTSGGTESVNMAIFSAAQRSKATRSESPPMGAPPLGAPPLGAPPLGAPPLGAPPLGAPPLGAPPLGAPPMGAPPLGAPPMGAPPLGAPRGVWGGRAPPGETPDAHIVTTAVEHSAVLEAANRAGRVTMAGVDGLGRYDPATVLAGLRPETALVSVQLANHEVGTIQPAAEVVAAARERGVLTHVDACAAAGHVPIDFGALGADLMSLTAHKFGGPRGIGVLLVRRGLRLPPFVLGGAQERDRRAGIENVMAAVGFAAAAAELMGSRPTTAGTEVSPGSAQPAAAPVVPYGGTSAGSTCPDRLAAEAEAARALTERLLAEAPKLVDGIKVFGDPVERLPHLVCFGVEGVEAEPVLLGLDQRGVAVHSGSSCSSETFEPSPVLSAMGVDADHSLRVSVGWSSEAADVDAFLAALPDVVGRLRSLRG